MKSAYVAQHRDPRAGPCPWSAPLIRYATTARAATGLVHLRSVPFPVALGQGTYLCSARPSVYRHRPPFYLWSGHIRGIIGLGAGYPSFLKLVRELSKTLWPRYPRTVKLVACLAPQLYGFARAVKVRASLFPLRFHL